MKRGQLRITAGMPHLLPKPGKKGSGFGRGACKGAFASFTRAFLPALSILLVSMLFLAWPSASPAAVQGDHIVNNAILTTSGNPAVTASATVNVVIRTPASIEFLKYAPHLASATAVNVHRSAYRQGGPAAPFTDLPLPTTAGSNTVIDLSTPLPLVPSGLFHQGEPLFVRVSDPDQNLDRTVSETVFFTITDNSTGDMEIVRLTETGPDTGVFTGHIQSSGDGSATRYNGTMSVSPESDITASYTDISDNTDVATCAALVDPFGIVFDSISGDPVDGVEVTLIDAATGNPATVFGDDGISIFPSTVVTGSTVDDSGGRHYDLPPGGFRFPFVVPGTYRFTVNSTAGYSAPSTVAQPAGNHNVVTGSRLEVFTLNPGPAIRIDIPMDPPTTSLWLQKSAGKDSVAIGDFLPYELRVENRDQAASALQVSITDTLPVGFRYRSGSVRINGAPAADPALSADGRTLIFSVGDILPQGAAVVRYVVEISAGARLGSATNRAVARNSGRDFSNAATASVLVRSDFLSSKSVLMGQVVEGGCGESDTSGLKGVEGVRIFLEDGTFVDSDKRGMFHFEGITPGSHVAQLDLDSLPEGYRAVSCEENTRFSGSAYSQFVDIQGGSVWRTDFHLARAAKRKEPPQSPSPQKGELTMELISSLQKDMVVYHLPMEGSDLPENDLSLKVTLPQGATYEPGSATLDGKPSADPQVTGNLLTFPLGRRPGDWRTKLSFRATLAKEGEPGELTTRATVIGTGMPEDDPAAPVAENLLKRVKEEDRFRMPEFVLHPHFPTFSAELTDEDRGDLEELARLLMVLNIRKITVTGHTDNLPIARRSRNVYRDNMALSLARAESVGRYLVERLQLPLESLELRGMGDKAPLADNRTEDGRAKNRRVEIKLRTERILKITCHEILKKESGLQISEVTGPAPKASGTEEKENEKEVAAAGEEKESGITEEEGILSPADNLVMAQPIHSVRICLRSSLTPHLLLDGREVPADRIGFSLKDPKNDKVIYSYIGVDFGPKGRHTLELKGSDPFGNTRFESKVEVVRSGEIASIRLKGADGNVADARTPVRLTLELLDEAGEVIPGEADLEVRGGTLKPFRKGDDGKALSDPSSAVDTVHLDGRGEALFRPVNASGLYTATLGTGKVVLETETYVKPMLRDWILVGIGEGSAGYNVISGHMENLEGSGAEERFYDNERLAFYAKGKVKGEWLLTMAYDSAKGKGEIGNRGLFQTIDPNTYYTLYGDASQQQYDAASARKIYLKIERDQFYALFGDFDTGMTVTELSRYSRRMNGLKAEYRGRNLEAVIFGTETPQSYVRDEIRGDGTSGIYRLSRRNIVLNSDSITVETRDRFRSEIVLDSRVMNRYSDYSIDYENGEIFFKEPINSRDDNFNPIFIVAEYETIGGDTGALTYGGRIGARFLGNRVKAGFTHIHEGQASGEGNSYGLDASWRFDRWFTLKGEAARTDSRYGADSNRGNAYLAEIEHRSKKLEARLYYRELESGFGLGQQNGSETGTRKFGAEGGYRFTDSIALGGKYYRQYNLATGGVQEVFEGKSSYASGPYSAWVGARRASDRLGDDSRRSSNQIFFGGSWLTLNKRLTLRAQHDQSIGSSDNADFPTRTTFGADFKLTRNVTLFAQQEITSGGSAKTNTTSAGMKSTPWEGGTVNTSMGRDLNENGDRVFALFGLKQTLKISDRWSVDGSLDRSQTIKNSRYYQFNVNFPSASGDNQDFTALSAGATYTEKSWNMNHRLEVRTSDSDDKWGIISSFLGEPREGWGWSARLQLFDTRSAAGLHSTSGDLRLGMVYRPLFSRWTILDRLDIIYDREHGGSSDGVSAAFESDSRRIVNNLNVNYKWDSRMQLSMQYGAKYVMERIDGSDYSGYTDLVGFEGRYDLTKEWDLGLRGSVLHSWRSRQLSYGSGVSIGYNVVKNAWVSLGYNVTGFSDSDFSAADFTAQGPYIRFRFKFDQNSVKDAVAWLNSPH